MSIFGDLMNKIFHSSTASAAQPAPGAPPAQSVPGAATPPAPTTTSGQGAPTQGSAIVDVTSILDKMATQNKQTLDWRHSIVDLMKLVGMDSSLSARRELAADLHYSGDTGDTATMNMWLHKEVMKKLAENGGKVPQELIAH